MSAVAQKNPSKAAAPKQVKADPKVKTPVAVPDGAPAIGSFVELPAKEIKSARTSKFAGVLNDIAANSAENADKFAAIDYAPSARRATGKAGSLRRKLEKGLVKGLNEGVDPKKFEIVTRGQVVYGRYSA